MTSVDVSVNGKRSTLARLTNRTLTAVINVSSIKEGGTHTLPETVSAAVNSNATYYVKGKDIKVVIEPIESATYKIEADILSPTDTSIILNSHELSKQKVKLVYIDAFAGSGKTILPDGQEVDGSAILSLQYNFDEFYFIEIFSFLILTLS